MTFCMWIITKQYIMVTHDVYFIMAHFIEDIP